MLPVVLRRVAGMSTMVLITTRGAANSGVIPRMEQMSIPLVNPPTGMAPTTRLERMAIATISTPEYPESPMKAIAKTILITQQMTEPSL